ncbi:MAG: transglutaminase-like domain-containing protein, partial [Planctomycetota bacterium]
AGSEEVDILGAKKTLVRLDTNLVASGMPMQIKIWVDEKGDAWRINTMGMVDIYRMPKELAQKQGDVGEVFLQTTIAPDKKIPNPREAKRLVYEFTLTEGNFDGFPTGGSQNILRKTETGIVVEVKASAPEKTLPLPVKAEEMDAYLASSTFLKKDDPLIQDLAKKAVGEETDAFKAALKLEKWVFEAIKKKNYGVGFATASEVAKTLEGDCSEHGVLLAALCRAVGIPSRVVGGLLYVGELTAPGATEPGAFGFHMWTEVYVGEWIALDATLGKGFADATHIVMARSALASESSIFELVPLGKYIGKLKIKVLDE